MGGDSSFSIPHSGGEGMGGGFNAKGVE